MKTKSIVMTMLLCFVGSAASFAAENPHRGTWKLDEAKSKVPAGMLKNTLVVYSADGDSIKVVTDGTDGKGNPMHTEWSGKFDGKDYPLSGDPTADSRSYKKVNEQTLTLANKKDGKVATSGRIVVSPDGKTRTLTVSAKDPAGKKITSTAIYDKQ
jgi:hypothetical protein